MLKRLCHALVPWLPLIGAVIAVPTSAITMHLPPPVAVTMFFAIALVGATTSYIVDDDVKSSSSKRRRSSRGKKFIGRDAAQGWRRDRASRALELDGA